MYKDKLLEMAAALCIRHVLKIGVVESLNQLCRRLKKKKKKKRVAELFLRASH